MPRTKSQRAGETAEAAFNRLTTWGASADASAEGVAEWDIKRDTFVDVMMAMLSDGLGVWLGVTRDGGAVSITLVDGDHKERKYVHDSVEWDDFWDSKVSAAQRVRNARKPVPLRAGESSEAAG